jgi:hypothetical protein
MREKKNLVLLALSAIVFATTVISVPSVFSEINPGAPSSQINRAGGASIDDGVLIQDNQRKSKIRNGLNKINDSSNPIHSNTLARQTSLA